MVKNIETNTHADTHTHTHARKHTHTQTNGFGNFLLGHRIDISLLRVSPKLVT